MREALALVREKLGLEAVVLGSREISKRRFPWSATRIETEVTAAVGIDTRPSVQAQAAQAAELDVRLKRTPCLPAQEFEPHDNWPQREAHSPMEPPPLIAHEFPSSPDTKPALPDALFRMFTRLIDAEVDEEHARNVLFEARESMRGAHAEEADLTETLLSIIETHLRCSGGLTLDSQSQKVVALVGPTGVGKTTTIAKLAANFHLAERRKIGLITLDTFRVGAVDQLRTYAEVIGLPMRSASTPDELVDALGEFADRELVLIDTAGRSPRDEPRIQELRDLLSDAAIDEVHLVLSLASSHRSLVAMVDRFRGLRPTQLLLTKLDEAAGLGAIYSAARSIDLPLSYFTTGQDVPDDIERAAPGRTARLILGFEDLMHGRERAWKQKELKEPTGPIQAESASEF